MKSHLACCQRCRAILGYVSGHTCGTRMWIYTWTASPRSTVMTWLKRLMFTVVQEKPRPALGVHSSAAAAFSDVQGRCSAQFLSSVNMCNPPKRVKCWNSQWMCSWLCWPVWWRKASGYAILSSYPRNTRTLHREYATASAFFEADQNELQRQCRGD